MNFKQGQGLSDVQNQNNQKQSKFQQLIHITYRNVTFNEHSHSKYNYHKTHGLSKADCPK